MKIEHQKIAETTLNLLEKKTWNSLTLNDVNKRLKFKVSSKGYDRKNELLKNINKYFDFKLKKSMKSIENSSPKDMVFEIIMTRFDILQKNRISVNNIFDFLILRPKELTFLVVSILESIILIANLANINHKGTKGMLRIKGLLIIYLSTFLVWRKDKTESLDKTMISLDNYLNHADKIITNFKI